MEIIFNSRLWQHLGVQLRLVALGNSLLTFFLQKTKHATPAEKDAAEVRRTDRLCKCWCSHHCTLVTALAVIITELCMHCKNRLAECGCMVYCGSRG